MHAPETIPHTMPPMCFNACMENTSQVQVSQEAVITLALHQLASLVDAETLAYCAAECRSNAYACSRSNDEHTALMWQDAAIAIGDLHATKRP